MTVTIKVKRVEASEMVKTCEGKELEKQDCVVGDSSGCARVVLWEKDVGHLTEGESYKVQCSWCWCLFAQRSNFFVSWRKVYTGECE